MSKLRFFDITTTDLHLVFVVAGLLWSVLYAHHPLLKILQTILSMIFIDFFLVGICVATLLWAISNRFFTHSSHTHATDQSVEWAYSFDVHVNSFFPLFVDLYLAQLVLSPVLTRSNWVCLFFGNTLYLGKLNLNGTCTFYTLTG
jgi:hypothetical protein